MKTLSQLINEQLVFESFEDFCFYKKIENVSLTTQKEFLSGIILDLIRMIILL